MSFEDAVGRAVDRLGPDRLRTIADGIQAGSSLTALCSAHSMAGYTDMVRAIVLSQDSLADEVAVAYLRGAADGYEGSEKAERIEAVL